MKRNASRILAVGVLALDIVLGAGRSASQDIIPVAHHGAIRIWWEMVTVADGQIAAVGQEFLVLDDDGRIRSDHQFPIAA